jgi:hypothetical protein
MGLTWEFTERSTIAIFMDLTISLASGRFSTSIYSKPMSLHLYISPDSCHAPGIETGLIFGHTLRVLRLCSKHSDIHKELKPFYHRLVKRGYSSTLLQPFSHSLPKRNLMQENKLHMKKTINWNDQTIKDKSDIDSQLFFHLPFHLLNPGETLLQRPSMPRN